MSLCGFCEMNSGCLDLCQVVNSLSHWANLAVPKVLFCLFFKYIDIKQRKAKYSWICVHVVIQNTIFLHVYNFLKIYIIALILLTFALLWHNFGEEGFILTIGCSFTLGMRWEWTSLMRWEKGSCLPHGRQEAERGMGRSDLLPHAS